MKKKVAFILLALFLIVAIKFTNSIVTIAIKNTSISPKAWENDINYLRSKLIQKHVNIYANISSSELNTLFDNLLSSLDVLDEHQIQIELLKVLSEVGDSHTEFRNFITGADLAFPVELYWFNDGYYVVNTVEVSRAF